MEDVSRSVVKEATRSSTSTLIGQYNSTDRFIPRRVGTDLDAAHYKLTSSTTIAFDPFSKLNEAPARAYRNVLQKVLDTSENERILNFSTLPNTRHRLKESRGQWPVLPRKKRLWPSPETVLDLPDFEDNFNVNVIDWSASGYMTAGLRKSVFLWHAPSDKHLELTDLSPEFCTAVKWNSQGDRLAVASSNGTIQVWRLDDKTMVMYGVVTCPCYSTRRLECAVLSAAFHPTNSSLVSGCSKGVMCKIPLDFCTEATYLPAHDNAVITMKFSCDGKHLATSSQDCMVKVWLWPSLLPLYEVTHGGTVRAVAWHPWRPSYLCTAGSSDDGTIYLWNINTQEMLGSCVTSSLVCCMEWSQISGELVTSHWLPAEERNEILIWSSFTEIVGKLRGHIGKVLYLAWNSDGTKLATAGADEALRIWNYHSVPKKRVSLPERRSLDLCRAIR